MSFVSYAQNFEDVMLWRSLKHVDCGFYIDVGANDPEIDSVTKAFYDRGWRGVNIEPVAEWYTKLEAHRPRDINLQLAAGAAPGEVTFYEFAETGLSTSKKQVADRHEASGKFHPCERLVQVDTLTSICERFHVAPIHFIKIDVEGAEGEVLEGLDLTIIRPWIIVVESTQPRTQTEDHAQWEPIICSARYAFAYFDGLNRFYIAQEHAHLSRHFTTPPNVFDDYVRASEVWARLRVQEESDRAMSAETLAATEARRALEAETAAIEYKKRAEMAETDALDLGELVREVEGLAAQQRKRADAAEEAEETARQKAASARERADHLEVRAIGAENLVLAMRQSSSWKVTSPLRWIAEWLWGEKLWSKKSGFIQMLNARSQNSRVSQRIVSVIHRLIERGSSQRSVRGARLPGPVTPQCSSSDCLTFDDLTPRAKQIFMELKRASSSHSDEI